MSFNFSRLRMTFPETGNQEGLKYCNSGYKSRGVGVERERVSIVNQNSSILATQSRATSQLRKARELDLRRSYKIHTAFIL